MAQINGAHHFSGSKADREYWTQNTRDAEKDIIKIRSHEKLLFGNITVRAPLSSETSSALQDGISQVSSSRAKRNQKQCLAYKK